MTATLATKQQKIDIRRNCDWKEDIKEEWVQWATGDVKKTSLNDLTFEQADKILKQQLGTDGDAAKFQKFDCKNRQHVYILSMLHQIGWTKVIKGRTVGDMVPFGHWLQKYSPIKLPLTQMGVKQTQKVIYAFEEYVKYTFS